MVDGYKLVVGIYITFCILGIGIFIYDSTYINPVAAQNANEVCQENGFDFYDGYQRVGIFSKEPVAIKCKYVDQYRQVDFNNQNPLVEVNN